MIRQMSCFLIQVAKLQNMWLKSRVFNKKYSFGVFFMSSCKRIAMFLLILQHHLLMENRLDILFILNPISGTVSKEKIPTLIEKKLDKEQFNTTIIYTQYAGHAKEIAHEARLQGTDIVVAVGGDGTVNEVASALVHSDTALGIIPCGSGNGLARHLLLPMNIEKAIDVINECKVKALDYGIINDNPFFCTCGMGFDAFISMKFANSNKRGVVSYVENVLLEGLTYQPEIYEIEDESGTKRYKAFLISCANASQYGNNAYIAPQASMSDGMLDVIIMEPFDIFDAPQISIDMFNKTLNKNSKIKTFKTKKIKIHRSKPGYIHYDGDPVETGRDIEIAIQEKGIKVIINANGDVSKRQPNVLQTAFNEFFNNIHLIRDDINKQGRHIQAIGKNWQRKLKH